MSKDTPLKFVFRELTLTAGQIKRVHEVASFFMLVSNTGTLDVQIAIDDNPFSDFPAGYKYQEKKDDEYYQSIDFKNPNVGSVTVEYIVSIGIVESAPAITGIADVLEELTGLSTGAIYDTEKNIGVAQSQVMAVNAARHSGNVQAKSTNAGIIYIGYDNLVTSVKWIAELQAGQAYSFDDWLGTIHAIATVADQKLGYGEH